MILLLLISISPSIFNPCNSPTLITFVTLLLISIVFPAWVNPTPALILPAPENCVKSISSIPTVLTFPNTTKPWPLLYVPAITNV